MVATDQLRLVLVTPERTLLDEPVVSLRFPLFDGQMGVLPGRAPMVGRLGYGELLVRTSEGEQSYFVDGGFVQIRGFVVSLLTDRALPFGEIDGGDAERQLQAARETRATSDAQISARHRDVERARRLLALSRKPR